jgi:hypothetical protein
MALIVGTDSRSCWIPLCHCMQLYCEPYFLAINRWRSCRNIQLLANRINALDTVESLLIDYSQKFYAGVSYDFDLFYESSRQPVASHHLYPAVTPSSGILYHPHGDLIAINAAKATFFSSCGVDSLNSSFSSLLSSLFNKIGAFFQRNLLFQLAGHDDDYLLSANLSNRIAIISLLEKLFRVSNDAGNIRFVYRKRTGTREKMEEEEPLNEVYSEHEGEENDEEGGELADQHVLAAVCAFYPLSEKAMSFLTILIENQYDSIPNTSSSVSVPPTSLSSPSFSCEQNSRRDSENSLAENPRKTNIDRPSCFTEQLEQNGSDNASCHSFKLEEETESTILLFLVCLLFRAQDCFYLPSGYQLVILLLELLLLLCFRLERGDSTKELLVIICLPRVQRL